VASSAPNQPVLRLAVFCAAVAPMAAGTVAHAESIALPVLLPKALLARPIGGSSGGGHVGRGPMGGPLLGVEGSWATTLAANGDSSMGSGALGVRAGWAFANGLAVHVRYDDLGVEPASSRSPLQLATFGLRYSLPFFVLMPFAEVDAGPAFVLGDVQFGASAGLGLSVPLGPYVLIDAVARDWFVPIADTLRQTLTVGVGLTILFPSPGER
jgi:hypothetical protein